MALRERTGKWHYRFVLDGREYTGSTGLAAVPKNTAKAMSKEEAARRLIEEGKSHLVKVKAKPFNEALIEYLRWAKGEHADSPATYADARSKTAVAVLYFGQQFVHTITPGQLENFKTWRRAGDAAHEIAPVEEVTIRHNLHQLSKFFRWATKQGWTRQNPVEDVDIPSDADSFRMHVLTAEEEALYFKTARDLNCDHLHDTGRLMIQQGMRPAECFAIQKADIDLLSKRLSIRGRETRAGKRRTKSSAGTRVLPLTQESMAICAKWISADNSKWLFESRHLPGESIRRTNKAHSKVLDACGLDFVLYDFRHTFATRAAAAGVPLATLAKLLGHADLKTIHRYVHPQDDHLADAMAMIEAASGIRPDSVRATPDITGQDQQTNALIGKMHGKEIDQTKLKTQDLHVSDWRCGSGSNRRMRVLQTLNKPQ